MENTGKEILFAFTIQFTAETPRAPRKIFRQQIQAQIAWMGEQLALDEGIGV